MAPSRNEVAGPGPVGHGSGDGTANAALVNKPALRPLREEARPRAVVGSFVPTNRVWLLEAIRFTADLAVESLRRGDALTPLRKALRRKCRAGGGCFVNQVMIGTTRWAAFPTFQGKFSRRLHSRIRTQTIAHSPRFRQKY